MYEALRQRAPASSKITGITATALALAGATYVAMSGLGEQVAKVLTDPTIFIIVPPTRPPDSPPIKQELDTSTERLVLVKPEWTPPVFVPDDSTIVATEGPVTTSPNDASASVAPAGPAPTRPKMLDTAKPTYPAVSIRLHEQGTTAIQLCISPAGRVTAATLAQSSGYSRLDEAAMKWIRGVRFTPGTIDGRPAAACGHTVSYEWKIEELR